MRHYREQTETMTATRRLQALSRRHASGSSARHDAAGHPSAKRVPQQSMASHDLSVVSSSPPPPPPSDAARHSTSRKVSIGQLSGVREHDADITVERRVCKTMPRMSFTPGHALAAILLLVAVTCASLTLLVRQSLNYAAASRPQERQTIQTYESQEAEASAGGRTNRSQVQHDSDQEKSGQSQSDSTSASQAERFSTQSDGGLVNLNTATLEELEYADLLLHVIDVSNPEWQHQAEVVEKLIVELGANEIPRIDVFNKCDCVEAGDLRPHGEDICSISARTGEGVDRLLEMIDRRLDKGTRRVTIPLPYDKGGLLDMLYREAKVESVEYSETIDIVAVCPPKVLGQIGDYTPDWTPPKEDWE